MVSQPLNVLIVGGGIGGLTTGIGLRRQGHHVEIFEKSDLTRENGAGITLSPNCTTLLKRFDVDLKSAGGTELRKGCFISPTGEVLFEADYEKVKNATQADYFCIRRVDLHNELRRKATAADGKGPPVQLSTGCTVSQVDCDRGIVTLADGEQKYGDVVVVADGSHSKIRKDVTGCEIQPIHTEKSCYRCFASIADIKSDPETARLVEASGTMTEIIGDDRRITFYPCSNESMYVGAFLPTSEVGPTQEGKGWGRSGNKADLLASFSDFPLPMRQLLAKAPEHGIKVWDLFDCPEIEEWTKGRAALIGDAAHPFLPYMGQGGAMAIEDAASIAVLLPMGATAAEVPARLELFQRCRSERVHNCLRMTRLRGRDLSGKQGQLPTGREMAEFAKYCLDHDEWEHSSAILGGIWWE